MEFKDIEVEENCSLEVSFEDDENDKNDEDDEDDENEEESSDITTILVPFGSLVELIKVINLYTAADMIQKENKSDEKSFYYESKKASNFVFPFNDMPSSIGLSKYLYNAYLMAKSENKDEEAEDDDMPELIKLNELNDDDYGEMEKVD